MTDESISAFDDATVNDYIIVLYCSILSILTNISIFRHRYHNNTIIPNNYTYNYIIINFAIGSNLFNDLRFTNYNITVLSIRTRLYSK